MISVVELCEISFNTFSTENKARDNFSAPAHSCDSICPASVAFFWTYTALWLHCHLRNSICNGLAELKVDIPIFIGRANGGYSLAELNVDIPIFIGRAKVLTTNP